MMPYGYWTVPAGTPNSDVQNFSEKLNERIAQGKPVILRGGVEFHPFPQPAPALVTPDAFCRYCAAANLRVSTECLKCGAPLVRQP